MVTLRQLRYLGALAEHGHFGRAAAACAISQPALSMQIRALERQLGVELVERRPGQVALTDIGAEVVERGKRLLAGARDLVDFASHHGRPLTGRLTLGLIPTLAPYVLPRLLPALQQRYPELRVTLRETQTRILLEELVRGALDAAMLALPIPDPELETLRLFEDPFWLAVPAGDPWREKAQVTPRDIDTRRLILLEEGHCLRDQALSFCAAVRQEGGAGLGLGLGATSLATVMQMVANGYGVTFVPQVAIDVEVRDDRVRLLRFARPEPSRTIGLVWRRTSPRRSDFIALGKVVTETSGHDPEKPAPAKEHVIVPLAPAPDRDRGSGRSGGKDHARPKSKRGEA
jgi:LysR family hydrogen peroxide-inducible transcriptional activator